MTLTSTTHSTPSLDLDAITPNSPAMRLPGHLDPVLAAAMAAAVAEFNFAPYRVTVSDGGGAAYFFGANLYDTPLDPSGLPDYPSYFATARRDRDDLARVYSERGLPHPLDDLLVPVIATGLGTTVELAKEAEDRAYYAPVIRSTVNGIHLHRDHGPSEAPKLLIGQVEWQHSILLYLATPGDGSGALQVFHKRPTVEDDRDHVHPAYGYTEAAITGIDVTTIVPEPGDLVVFDTWNLHRVLPSTPGTERVTVSAFCGGLPDGRVIVWS